MEPPFAPTSWAPAWRPRCASRAVPRVLAGRRPDEAERLTRAGVTALIVDDLALLARLAAPVSAAPERPGRPGAHQQQGDRRAEQRDAERRRLDAEAEGERRLGAQAVGRDEGRDERRVPHSDVAGEIATTPDSTISAYTRMAAWAGIPRRAARAARLATRQQTATSWRPTAAAASRRRARTARPRRGRAPRGRSAPAGAGRPAPAHPRDGQQGDDQPRQGHAAAIQRRPPRPAGRGMTIAATATTTKVTRPSTPSMPPRSRRCAGPLRPRPRGGGGWRRTGRRGRAVRAGARPRRARAVAL